MDTERKPTVSFRCEKPVIDAVDKMVEALARRWGYGANVTRAMVLQMAVVRGLPIMEREFITGTNGGQAYDATAAESEAHDG